ncbi:uncharacterized protein LOC121369375 isoform X1 [Gigantopelta aegis]|uniref:uncharacterized protein LOC121369375 isoform X1 n=1 Tax=Gigantopelta aegis TaxID=1735272 RepID=UPI001B88E39C|nr:uncharacterized protein LOC121369375 isoform X1 [Gigantopelta aegis]
MDFHISNSVILMSMLMMPMALMSIQEMEDSTSTSSPSQKTWPLTDANKNPSAICQDCYTKCDKIKCSLKIKKSYIGVKCPKKNLNVSDVCQSFTKGNNSQPVSCQDCYTKCDDETTKCSLKINKSYIGVKCPKKNFNVSDVYQLVCTTYCLKAVKQASFKSSTQSTTSSVSYRARSSTPSRTETSTASTSVTSISTHRTTPVATSHSSPLSTTTYTSTPVPQGLASEPSKSAVVGGAVGAVLGLAVIVGLVLLAVWTIRRRNARHHKDGTRESREYTGGHDQTHADGVENQTYQNDYQHRPYIKTYPLGIPGDDGNTQNECPTLVSWPPMDEMYNKLGEVTDDVSASHNVYNRINISGVTTSTGSPCLK